MLWNAKNGTVSLGDTDMYYVSYGNGERSLVILPGLSDGLATVKGKALLLAPPYQEFMKDFTVYMFSRKNRMPEGYTIEQMAEDQALALQKLGIRRASVMGVSEGGMIAMSLSAAHPDLVDKLVLAVTAPKTNDIIRESVSEWIALAEKNDHKQLMISTAERSYSEAYLKKYRKMYPVIGMVGKPKNYQRFLVNANATLNFNAEERLAEITCPVLVIGGEDDRIVGPQASYDMAKKLPECTLYMYPGLGHAAYEEAEDFNHRVYRFLKD